MLTRELSLSASNEWLEFAAGVDDVRKTASFKSYISLWRLMSILLLRKTFEWTKLWLCTSVCHSKIEISSLTTSLSSSYHDNCNNCSKNCTNVFKQVWRQFSITEIIISSRFSRIQIIYWWIFLPHNDKNISIFVYYILQRISWQSNVDVLSLSFNSQQPREINIPMHDKVSWRGNWSRRKKKVKENMQKIQDKVGS